MSCSRTCCILLLLIALAAAAAAAKRNNVPLPLPMQLRIWQCRQRCYQQTLLQPPTTTTPQLCRTRPDCFMCHDYCRVLAIAEWSLATSMCADSIFCSQGCRTACKFHQLNTAAAAGVAASATTADVADSASVEAAAAPLDNALSKA